MIRNLVEDHVRESYVGLRPRFPDFCGCDICREDVLVYALNRVLPRYVTTLEGQVVTAVNLDRDQSRAAIDVAIIDAIRRVTIAPRCGRSGPMP
jgi:competence protein ComFB